MFFPTIKAIHLLALVLGAGASLGNIYLLLARGPADLPRYRNRDRLREHRQCVDQSKAGHHGAPGEPSGIPVARLPRPRSGITRHSCAG